MWLNSLDTPPGTKLLLKPRTKVANGFYILNDETCQVLGGNVTELYQKWKLNKVCLIIKQNNYSYKFYFSLWVNMFEHSLAKEHHHLGYRWVLDQHQQQQVF